MVYRFENLEAYKKALSFAEQVALYGRSRQERVLNDQIRRASLSIVSNIAEGAGRWHANDKIHFFRMALGSAHECVPQLYLLKASGILDENHYLTLKDLLEEIGRLINGLIRFCQSRPQ